MQEDLPPFSAHGRSLDPCPSAVSPLGFATAVRKMLCCIFSITCISPELE